MEKNKIGIAKVQNECGGKVQCQMETRKEKEKKSSITYLKK